MTIRLQMESKIRPGVLLWLLLFLLCSFGTLTDLLNVPDFVTYSLDPIWILLLVLMVGFRRKLDWTAVKGLIFWVLGFLILTLAVILVRGSAGVTYLWGLRNNFRGYVIFFAGAVFWTKRDVQRFWQVLDGLFWLNAGVSMVQFALGYRQDFFGGLFGVYSGVNTYTNLFLAVTVSRTMICYLAEREGIFSWAAKCAAALAVAAMAELKFFFGEFLVILVLAVLFSERTARKCWVVFGGVCAVLAGAALLTALFPGWGDWFSPEAFWKVATDQRGYTSSGDLNRLTAVAEINRRFFRGFWEKIFGFGLGNCELSGFSFLTTAFARDYQYLHYHWMSIAFVYLEMGWLGLIFFFGFFMLVFVQAKGRGKEKMEALNCRTARILAVICMMTGVYNASLRSEPGYLAYLTMSLAFASGRDKL